MNKIQQRPNKLTQKGAMTIFLTDKNKIRWYKYLNTKTNFLDM